MNNADNNTVVTNTVNEDSNDANNSNTNSTTDLLNETPVEEVVVVEDPTVVPDPDVFRHVTMVGHDKSSLLSTELTESVIYATDGKLDSFKITNSSGSVFEYSRDTAIAAVDTGTTTNNEVSWGRWTDMNLTVTDNSGTNSVAVTNANSVHWGVSNEFEDVTLPIAGTFNYQVVGGTTPTDNYGGLGTLNTTSSSQLADVDFASQTASLNISINNLVDPEDEFSSYDWTLQYDMEIHADGTLHSTNNPISDPTSNPILMAASAHPGTNVSDAISGTANGSFAGFSTDAAPTAAVISYEANRTYTGWLSGSPLEYQIRGVVAAELIP